MTEISPVLNWGALGVLLAVLAGLFWLVRQWMDKQDVRENKRIDLEHERDTQRNGTLAALEEAKMVLQERQEEARKKDTDWLRAFLDKTRQESNEMVMALQALANDQTASNRQVAQAINTLAREMNETNNELRQVIQGNQAVEGKQ